MKRSHQLDCTVHAHRSRHGVNQTHIKLAAAALLASLAMGGCATNRNDADEPSDRPMIDNQGNMREALVGDTVTFVSKPYDIKGSSEKVKWSSTGGEITTEQNGRIARVRFTEPGTYTVRGILEVDGKPVKSDIIEVRVNAVE